MSFEKPHISVCICTYKRPEFLKRLLHVLANQATDGLFTYSIVVADNDALRSAEAVVSQFAAEGYLSVHYCVEPKQNIALARNKALENAQGAYVAFIDDDEFPTKDWLRHLFSACLNYDVEGVLGPIKAYFECPPPEWARKGKFFERPSYATGYKLTYAETRTGNLLFKRQILDSREMAFRAEFDTGGEDIDFFRRMMGKGSTFIWCNEALVYEVVPQSRCKRSYLLKRALLRGSNFPKNPTHRFRNAVKSLIAVPCYSLALPFLALLGEHVILNYAIKLCDHSSRLLALVGLRLMTRRDGLA